MSISFTPPAALLDMDQRDLERLRGALEKIKDTKGTKGTKDEQEAAEFWKSN
jgi:hypothetical protein